MWQDRMPTMMPVCHSKPAAAETRTKSPSNKRRSNKKDDAGQIPIKFITVELDERRDDSQQESNNMLVVLIHKKDWSNVMKHMKTKQGILEASRALDNGDYALHCLCRCNNSDKPPSYDFIALNNDSGGTRESIREDRSDGDSWSDPSSGTLSSSGRISKRSDIAPPPSKAVLEALLDVYPHAVKQPGAGESWPLHWAIRHKYDIEFVKVLIRAFPQALDKRDMTNRTPRQYGMTVYDSEDIRSRSVLLRPTSCWLQQLQDERTSRIQMGEIVLLEREIQLLVGDVETAQLDEEALVNRIEKLEYDVEKWNHGNEANVLSEKAGIIKGQLESSMDVLRATLEGLAAQNTGKYTEEEKERALLKAFNEDVERIYNNAQVGIEEMKQELKNP